MRWPGKIQAGSVRDELVLNLDYPETILDLAGRSIPQDMQGRSLKPLLMGKGAADWRQSFYYRYYYSHFETPSHYGLRSQNHKLVHWDSRDEWELYDLQSDLQETNNLASNPEWSATLASLKAELQTLQRNAGDDPTDIGDHPRTGNAELDNIEAERLKHQTQRAR